MAAPPREARFARSPLIALAGAGGALYLAFVGMIAFLQNSLIYFPQRESLESLEPQARLQGLRPWRDETGAYQGWRPRLPEDGPTPANRLVAFHGNAGHALHRSYFVDGFRGLGDGRLWEPMLFEYPGYGAREGKPGEKAIVEAAKRAVAGLRRDDARPVFLLGESLGSGVAAQVAAAMPGEVAGLFLVTPFTGLADVGRRHYPWLPVGLLLRDRYDAEEALKAYRGPAAFLLAGRDEVVPVELGRRLYEGYQGPKELWVQEEAGHNALDYRPQAPWWEEVSDFLLAAAAAE